VIVFPLSKNAYTLELIHPADPVGWSRLRANETIAWVFAFYWAEAFRIELVRRRQKILDKSETPPSGFAIHAERVEFSKFA
jgi:hypothetical protein